jgi:hypothetical protein
MKHHHRTTRITGRARAEILAAALGTLLCVLGPAAAAHGTTHSDAGSPGRESAVPQARAAFTQISTVSVDRLLQSTANLYWTTNTINEFGPSTSAVFRMNKNGTNQRSVFRMTHDGEISFGALAYARIGTAWFGFVVVNNSDTRKSQIWRFPLAGGAAVSLGTSPGYVGESDLVTDGTTLYWGDHAGLRSIPVIGGPVRMITLGPAVERVQMGTTSVYFTVGRRIVAIPKRGGPMISIATASTKVTALHVAPAKNSKVFWGEADGSVRGLVWGLPGRKLYQPPVPGREVRSVGYDGLRVLWGSCTPAGNACRVTERRGTVTSSIAFGGVGVTGVQGDAAALFWGDTRGVFRHRH